MFYDYQILFWELEALDSFIRTSNIPQSVMVMFAKLNILKATVLYPSDG